MNNEYDCIIVGAGPAGTTAAKQLSQKGKKALLLEKYKLPRYKCCAGGLPPRVTNMLDFDFSETLENEVSSVVYSYKNKQRFHASPKDFSIKMVMRNKFDFLLANKAKEFGTEIKDNTVVRSIEKYLNKIKVTAESNGILQTFIGDFLIGADGVNSLVAKQANFREENICGVALSCEIYFPELSISGFSNGPEYLKPFGNRIIMDIGDVPSGYCWIFPKKNSLSAGVCTTLSKLKDLKKYLMKFLEVNSLFKYNITYSISGALLPFFKNRGKVGNDRILLVGDAAGFVDPLSGEGIHYAIESGQMASAIINNVIDGNEKIYVYTELIEEKIYPELNYALKFANLLFSHPLVCFKLGMRNKRVNEIFTNLICGKKTYKDIYEEIRNSFAGKFYSLVKRQTT